MKIAIFTDSFLPGIGGTENAILRLAVALSKKHEVMVFAPSYGDKKFDETLPVKVARTKSLKVSKNDRWAFPDISPKFKKALKDFAPDVLHCQTVGTTCGYANRYAKKYDVPLIYTVHTKFRYCYVHAVKSKTLAEMVVHHIAKRVKKADEIYSVSYSMQDELKSYGVDREVKIIRNGAEKKGDAAKDVKKIPHDKFAMIFVGLVIDYKNIEFSLRALEKVKAKGHDFVFYIVGRGPQEKYFKKLVEKLGLKDNVVFTGAIQDKEKLSEMYLKADLMLFPSVFDNDALVKIEAANGGTPILVLKGTGEAEQIKDGVNGFVSEPDVDSYAEKIIALMGEKDKLADIGKKAQDIFYTWDDAAEKYEQAYQKLIEEKKKK